MMKFYMVRTRVQVWSTTFLNIEIIQDPITPLNNNLRGSKQNKNSLKYIKKRACKSFLSENIRTLCQSFSKYWLWSVNRLTEFLIFCALIQ